LSILGLLSLLFGGTFRELLFNRPVFTMISIVIIAPITEELIFRKSLAPIVKNRFVYALICGILFGGAHLLTGEFVLSDLLYILPYGSLGFAFALMDYDSKTTCSSIVIHSMHNFVTAILLFITYSLGVL
jgi:membrane protease YdiL (CAAX protease family)